MPGVGDVVGQALIEEDLEGLSKPAVGAKPVGDWFRGTVAGQPDQFIQVIESNMIVRRPFDPGGEVREREAWERLTGEDIPTGMRRMLLCNPEYKGHLTTLAFEYTIWDDPKFPCLWLSTLLSDERDEKFSLASFLNLGTTLWKASDYLHSYGLLHYNIRPSSILGMRVSEQDYRFSIFNVSLAFAPETVPSEEQEYYEARGAAGDAARAYDDDYEHFDAGCDSFGLIRVLVRVLARLAPPVTRADVLWNRVEKEIDGLAEDVVSGVHADIEKLENGAKRVVDSFREDGLRKESLTGDAVRAFHDIQMARVALKATIEDADLIDDFVKYILGKVPIPGPERRDPEFDALRVRGGGDGEQTPSVARIMAHDRGQGVENADPCKLELVGHHLRTVAGLSLVPVGGVADGAAVDEDEIFEDVTETGGGATTPGEPIPLARFDDYNESQDLLCREAPSLEPGLYDLVYRDETPGRQMEKVSGLRLEVAEWDGPPHFEDVNPTLIEDGSRPTDVAIRGRRLHRVDELELTLAGEPVPGRSLSPVEDMRDSSATIIRRLPPLSDAGTYGISHEGEPTTLTLDVRLLDPTYERLSPASILNDEDRRITVKGDYLVPGKPWSLVSEDGAPATTVKGDVCLLAEESLVAEQAVLRIPRGLRPGIYELRHDGVETDLGLTATCRVDDVTPRRLHLKGKPQTLTISGGLFDPDGECALRRGGHEFPLGQPRGDHARRRCAVPRDLRTGQYDFVMAGLKTGHTVKVRRFSMGLITVGGGGSAALLILLILLLSFLVAGTSYDAVTSRSGDAECTLVPDESDPDEKRGDLEPGIELVLEGSSMAEGRRYILARRGEADPLADPLAELEVASTEQVGSLASLGASILGLVGLGSEDAGPLSKVHFVTLGKLRLNDSDDEDTELELCVLDSRGGVARRKKVDCISLVDDSIPPPPPPPPPAELPDLIDKADEDWRNGEGDPENQAKFPEVSPGDWNSIPDNTARDRMRLYYVFPKWYTSGKQKQALEEVGETPFETEIYQAVFAWMRSIEKRCFKRVEVEFPPRPPAADDPPWVDFETATPDIKEDDWIGKFLSGYHAYLQLSLQGEFLGEDERKQITARALEMLGSIKNIKSLHLVSFMLAEIENKRFPLSPDGLSVYFGERRSALAEIRAAKPDPGAPRVKIVPRAAVRGAERLEDQNPFRAAMLCWSFVQKAAPGEDIPGEAELTGIYKRVRDQLDPDVVAKMNERFE